MSDEKLNMKTPDSTLAGGTTCSPPSAEPFPTHGDEGEAEGEDIKAPVELLRKFLRAVMDRDLPLARRLCEIILIYEPDHPQASKFLPLIQKKLLDEQEAEQSTEEEGDDDDDDDDTGSDEESPSDDDDDDEEKQVNRHKLCPPHILP